MTYAIIALVLIAVIAFLVMGRKKSGDTSQDSVSPSHADSNHDNSPVDTTAPHLAQPEPMSPMQSGVAQPTQASMQAAAPAHEAAYDYAPPRTSRLDDEGLESAPALAPGAFEAARANIGQEVPDDVLGEMLLDTTPEQAQQMFARVSPETLQVVTSSQAGVQFEGEASDDDWAALDGLGSAIDDLDIWDFGEADFAEGDRVVH